MLPKSLCKNTGQRTVSITHFTSLLLGFDKLGIRASDEYSTGLRQSHGLHNCNCYGVSQHRLKIIPRVPGYHPCLFKEWSGDSGSSHHCCHHATLCKYRSQWSPFTAGTLHTYIIHMKRQISILYAAQRMNGHGRNFQHQLFKELNLLIFLVCYVLEP